MSKYQNAQSWIEALDLYQGGKKHLTENAHKMSAYEAETLNNDLTSLKDTWQPKIEAAKLSELESALDGYKVANGKRSQAISKELARWNYSEINSARVMLTEQIKVEASRMQSAHDLKRLEEIYEGNMQGDINLQRATCEAMRGVVDFVPNGIRMESNHIGVKAVNDLAALRKTPELIEAETNLQKAVETVDNEIKQVARTAEMLGQDIVGVYGGTYEMGRAIRRVQKMNDGSLRIMDPNDPALSREFFQGLTEGSKGTFYPPPATKTVVTDLTKQRESKPK